MYAEPIGSAALGFLVVCAALAIPWLAWQYRRRGTITPARMWAQTSFLLYMMCAWALVLLPFPEVACARDVNPQLQWANWWQLAQASGRSGAVARLTDPNVVMFVFNVCLLLPLGVYLRRWFGRGLVVSAAIGFGVSLAFEVTQLTGIFGLYECPYRQFNVDDLFANTSGAVLGWLIAPLVFIVPRRGDDPIAPPDVTVPRRGLSYLIDLALAGLLTAVWNLVTFTIGVRVPALTITGSLLALCWVLPMLTGGRTPGQFCVGVRMTWTGGWGPVRLLVRWVIVWWSYPALTYLLAWATPRRDTDVGILALVTAGVVALWPLLLSTRIQERLSGTRTIPDTSHAALTDDVTVPVAVGAGTDSDVGDRWGRR